MRAQASDKPLPCLDKCTCIQARTRRLAELNDHMYYQGYPYGIKVLVKERWCFIEFHKEEPSFEAMRKSYGTDDIRVHWIGHHAERATSDR